MEPNKGMGWELARKSCPHQLYRATITKYDGAQGGSPHKVNPCRREKREVNERRRREGRLKVREQDEDVRRVRD